MHLLFWPNNFVPQHGYQASTKSSPMEEKQMEGLPQPLQEEHVFDALTNMDVWTLEILQDYLFHETTVRFSRNTIIITKQMQKLF